MRYTNVLGLTPATVVALLGADDYSKGDARYSVTEVLKPPQLGALARRHTDSIVTDVAKVNYRSYGSIIHMMLEIAGRASLDVWQKVHEACGIPWEPTEVPEPIIEERFNFLVNGVIVTAKPDSLLLYPSGEGRLVDYKFTSVWSVVHGPSEEWVAQLNIYRLGLHRTRNIAPTELAVEAHLRDWMVREAKFSKDYPQYGIAVVPIPVWALEQTEAFLEERVKLHLEADAALALGEPLVPCTDEERWVRPPKWAVMSEGRARALRLYDTEEEAQRHALTSTKLRVERRSNPPGRCSLYCEVGENGLCPQWEAEKALASLPTEGVDKEGRSSVE